MVLAGRRLWISYKFTDRRLVVLNTSPFFAKTVEISWSDLSEVRSAPRAFGLWGDMVKYCAPCQTYYECNLAMCRQSSLLQLILYHRFASHYAFLFLRAT